MYPSSHFCKLRWNLNQMKMDAVLLSYVRDDFTECWIGNGSLYEHVMVSNVYRYLNNDAADTLHIRSSM